MIRVLCCLLFCCACASAADHVVEVSTGGTIEAINNDIVRVTTSRSSPTDIYFREDAVTMIEIEASDRPGGNTNLYLHGSSVKIIIPKRMVAPERVIEAIASQP